MKFKETKWLMGGDLSGPGALDLEGEWLRGSCSCFRHKVISELQECVVKTTAKSSSRNTSAKLELSVLATPLQEQTVLIFEPSVTRSG